MSKFFLFCTTLVLGLVCGLGFAIAAAGEFVRLAGWELPCRSDVCGRLAMDPLNSLPPLTPGAAAMTYFALAFAAGCGVQRAKRALYWIAVPALLAAIGLVTYTRVRYGDFCPSCMMIFSCVSVSIATILLTPQISSVRLLILGASVGVALSYGLARYEANVGLNRFALSRMSIEEVNPPTSRIRSSEAGPVLLVDFSCTTCRNALAKQLESNKAFSVRSAQKSDYDEACARYLSGFGSPVERMAALRRVLADTSLVADAIGHLRRPAGPPDETSLARDRAFFRKLGVGAVPVELVLTERGYRVAEQNLAQP